MLCKKFKAKAFQITHAKWNAIRKKYSGRKRFGSMKWQYDNKGELHIENSKS